MTCPQIIPSKGAGKQSQVPFFFPGGKSKGWAQHCAVRLHGEFCGSLGKSPARPSPCSNHSPGLFAKARQRVFLFQCLFVPSPYGSELHPSLLNMLYILNKTPSTKQPLPNPIHTTCHSSSLSVMNNSASEPEKTLKILHIFKKTSSKDVKIFALIYLSHAFPFMKHVSTCKHLKHTTRACLSRFAKLALNIRAA